MIDPSPLPHPADRASDRCDADAQAVLDAVLEHQRMLVVPPGSHDVPGDRVSAGVRRIQESGLSLVLRGHVSAECAGGVLAAWLRLGLLDVPGAPADEWELADVGLVEFGFAQFQAWSWTFLWTHSPTGVAVMAFGLTAGTWPAPERAWDPGWAPLVVDAPAETAEVHITASAVLKSAGRFTGAHQWRAALTTQGLAETSLSRVGPSRVLELGAITSPLIATGPVQDLALLRGPVADEGVRMFVDLVGRAPVRTQPWVPREPWSRRS